MPAKKPCDPVSGSGGGQDHVMGVWGDAEKELLYT